MTPRAIKRTSTLLASLLYLSPYSVNSIHSEAEPSPLVSKYVIVKYGGSAITHKGKLETVHEDNLDSTACQVQSVLQQHDSPHIAIVHGAGSFGHFQAHKYGLKSGGGGDWVEGLCMTRQSVLKLNTLVTDSHIRKGVPAVSVSLFPTAICNDGALIAPGSMAMVKSLLSLGIIPVLHGDVLLDTRQKCLIYSGDRILHWVIKELANGNPTASNVRAVFLTDVAGVYDRPPGVQNDETGMPNEMPSLIKEIFVTNSGKILSAVDTSSHMHEHDVTGGMGAKIRCAADIARDTGSEVFIVQAGTDHALVALSGRACDSSKGFVGTKVSRLY